MKEQELSSVDDLVSVHDLHELQASLFEDENEPHPIVLEPRRVGRIAAATSIAIATTSVVGWLMYENFISGSGEVTHIKPSAPQEKPLDSSQNVLSWNMHNELSERYDELRQMIEDNDLDVINMQEVNVDDAIRLGEEFPDWDITYVMADEKTKGGYGNVLMSQYPLSDIKSLSMPGNPPFDELYQTGLGTINDVITTIKDGNVSTKAITDATQEDRSAVQATVPIARGDSQLPIRYETGHIGGDPKVHENQLHLFEGWTIDTENLKTASVICLDTNTSIAEMTDDMEAFDYQILASGEATTINGGHIDYCIIKKAGVIANPTIEVLPNHTDHYAILVKVTAANLE